jgi:hypothetical protein
MDERTMKELLDSLSWCDASSYHIRNVRELLAKAYPGADFSSELNEFVKNVTMPPGPGCPR